MLNSELNKILESQRKYFDAGNTLDINKRIYWLKQLKEALIKYQDELSAALVSDLNRQKDVSFVFEYKLVYEDINRFIKFLPKWSKDKKVKSSFLLYHKKAKITYSPHGQVYLIVPFNFPVLLGLQPLVGAIAAGNVTFYKPSRLTHNVNKVIEKILNVLPKELVYFLNTTLDRNDLEELNKYQWDFIFFTGSKNTATKIYSNQYSNFLPAVFELGGKSPMVIDETANLRLAAVKFLTTKLINSGQICLAVDYLIIKENVVSNFISVLLDVYNNELKNNQFFIGKLISREKSDEVNNWLINEDNSKFIIKDFHNVNGYDELKFALISYNDVNDKQYLDNELFSPLSYYRTFKDVEDIVKIIQEHDYPLTFYCFSKDTNFINYLKIHTNSGSFVVNDTLTQAMHSYLPFGGIRNSGIGSYHGKYSFLTFSIKKPCLYSKWYGDNDLFDIRNAFDDKKLLSKIIKKR